MASKKQSDETIIAVIGNDVSRIKSDVADIKTNMEHNYVSMDRFIPVQRVAYGSIALMVTILLMLVGYILQSKS